METATTSKNAPKDSSDDESESSRSSEGNQLQMRENFNPELVSTVGEATVSNSVPSNIHQESVSTITQSPQGRNCPNNALLKVLHKPM